MRWNRLMRLTSMSISFGDQKTNTIEGKTLKLVEGALKRLGDSTVNIKNEYVKYSLIQIGEQTFTDVMIDRKLNNFLQDGLQTTAPTKLWFLNGNKTIMAVQVANATRYYGKVNPFFYCAAIYYLGSA